MEDGENVTNRTVNAPLKTGQNAEIGTPGAAFCPVFGGAFTVRFVARELPPHARDIFSVIPDVEQHKRGGRG